MDLLITEINDSVEDVSTTMNWHERVNNLLEAARKRLLRLKEQQKYVTIMAEIEKKLEATIYAGDRSFVEKFNLVCSLLSRKANEKIGKSPEDAKSVFGLMFELNKDLDDLIVQKLMPRFRVTTKTEFVELALRGELLGYLKDFPELTKNAKRVMDLMGSRKSSLNKKMIFLGD